MVIMMAVFVLAVAWVVTTMVRHGVTRGPGTFRRQYRGSRPPAPPSTSDLPAVRSMTTNTVDDEHS